MENKKEEEKKDGGSTESITMVGESEGYKHYKIYGTDFNIETRYEVIEPSK